MPVCGIQRRWSLALLIATALAGPSGPVVCGEDIAVPKITHVFPAGGQRGHCANVTLAGQPATPLLQFWCSSGRITGSVAEDGKTASLDLGEACVPGVHLLRFFNAAGTSELLPFVVGTLAEVNEAEPNDRITEARAETRSSVVINGVLAKSGDVDCAAIGLTAGQTLVAAVQAQRGLGSPMDAVLQILSPTGTVLQQNDDDHGFDPQVVFTAPADGTYFSRVFAFPATPNSTIRFAGGDDYVYRLTLATDNFVDHPMPLALTSGDATTVQLHGWNLTSVTATAMVQPADNRQPESEIVATSAAGSTKIDVVGHAAFLEGHASTLPGPPFSMSGCISAPGERDTFRFSGTGEQQIEVSVSARSKDSLLDPVVILKTSDGKTVKDADDIARDNPDTRFTTKLPDDGQYAIEVSDRFGHGGERYYYLLTCAEPVPRYSLSVKASHLTVSAGKPLEIPIDVDRQNGFSEIVRVAADALPDGVMCEAMESQKDGDTSKQVTLKLSTTRTSGYSGEFRITSSIASPTDDSKEPNVPSVAAVVAVADGSTQTDSLWLTVPAPEANVPDE